MKGITRSSLTVPTESAVRIYREASRMLDQVDRRPVRLIGVSIYNLSGEEGRQLTFEDYFEDAAAQRDAELKDILDRLGQRYGLDFAGHLTQIMQMDTLHKTIEYMRSHS
jgi:DNA polymerase-4/DNA polymerase IV (DinB-like DNA polymerase)